MDFSLTFAGGGVLGGVGERVNAILATNEQTAAYGLVLTEADAAMLVETEQDALCEQDRVAIGESVLPALIAAFADSGYLAPEQYAETLSVLLDIFYEVKAATYDRLSDDVILERMARYFNGISGGSAELLRERDMEALSRDLLSGNGQCPLS